MRSKILCLFVMSLPLIAGAQNKTYTVQKGDTIEGIAKRFHVRKAELVAVNALSNSHKLSIGDRLRVPASRTATASPKTRVGDHATHVVRNGESDWSIARKHDMTVRELKSLNPSTDFINLKIGLSLNVKGEPVVASKPVAVAKKTASKAAPSSTRLYTIKQGDNDWLLARRLDIRVADLKALNPSVDLTKLRAGQKLRVPNGIAASAPEKVASKSAPAVKVASVRSKHAVVSGDSCIIRRGASTNTEKVAVVERGTKVAVLDRQGEWLKLRFPKGTVGWMRGDLLKPLKASDVAREINNRVAKNDSKPSTAKPTVRRETSKPTSKTVAKAPSKPATRVASRPPRSYGRPTSPTAKTSSRSSGRGDVVNSALDMLGTRYRWGGTSRSGVDCSGMVQRAYKQNGVSLPRTSREMASTGSKVSKGDLKKGDLVLFRTRRGSYVSHVGIYMGDGKFVHASSGKGRVTVSNINDGYYARTFVTARRVSGGSSKSTAKKEAPKLEAPSVDAEPKPESPVKN